MSEYPKANVYPKWGEWIVEIELDEDTIAEISGFPTEVEAQKHADKEIKKLKDAATNGMFEEL